MTDPWNGRPPGGAAERDGWHWVATMTSDTSLARWVAIVDQWMLVGTSRGYRPITDTAGWRYLGPCLPPAEIAALRAERDRLAADIETALASKRQATAMLNEMQRDRDRRREALREIRDGYTGYMDTKRMLRSRAGEIAWEALGDER